MVKFIKKILPFLLITVFVFPILAWAASASDSIDVNLIVRPGGGGGGVVPGGGPGPGPQPPLPPPPEPLPDLDPPANPSDFRAIYNAADNVIDLFWVNPTDPDFALVRIMRSTVFYPADPEDGELIYEGAGEEAIDSRIEPDTIYYYTIFARDESGNWSSGAIAREKTPKPGEKPVEKVEDPFKDFPEAERLPPEIQKVIDELYFDFIQNEKVVARFRSGDVDIDAKQPFRVRVFYEKLPEVLKTIAVTLSAPARPAGGPNNPSRTFTFLLRVSGDKTNYSATIGALLIPGIYPMQITLLDFKNQKITRFSGRLIVYGTVPLFSPLATQLTRRIVRTAAPIALSVGLAAGFIQTVILVSNVKSFYDIYLLILRFFGAFLGFLGLRRRRPPWGTVYDAVTKQPLDPAYVRVLSGGAEVANAITDLDGRYGFFLPSGSYQLTVNKTNYQFPSKLLSGRGRDELYNNLYFGEPIVSGEGEIINRNVPLDPVGFDWNEFVKNKRGLFRLYSRRERLKNFFFNGLYLTGFLFSLLAVIVTPIAFNFIVVGLYLVLFLFQIFWKFRHRVSSVSSDVTGEPLPFSIIRVWLPGVDQEVKAVVADELGRFYLLVSPGKYYITVEAKEADGSYSQVYRSGVLDLGRGVLSSDIYVNTFRPFPVRSWI